MPKKGKFEKHSSWTNFLSSLVFIFLCFCLSFSFLLVFTLNFSKHGCNGGEKEETYFSLIIIHVFGHACEACCGYSSINFAKGIGEVCNVELGLWEYGT